MFPKIIGGLLLLGFFYIQLVNSLECYSCNSVQSCKSPGKITCNADNSNQTTKYLTQNFNKNVTNMTSSNYKCLFLHATSVQTNLTYKGCVYDGISSCNLPFKNPSLKMQKCNQCNKKLCNSAVTFSSSMFSIFASIIVVTVYKVLNL